MIFVGLLVLKLPGVPTLTVGLLCDVGRFRSPARASQKSAFQGSIRQYDCSNFFFPSDIRWCKTEVQKLSAWGNFTTLFFSSHFRLMNVLIPYCFPLKILNLYPLQYPNQYTQTFLAIFKKKPLPQSPVSSTGVDFYSSKARKRLWIQSYKQPKRACWGRALEHLKLNIKLQYSAERINNEWMEMEMEMGLMELICKVFSDTRITDLAEEIKRWT